LNKYILLLSLVISTGCVKRQADIIAPQYLNNGTLYEIKGNQGFLPGRKISFGGFKGIIEKDRSHQGSWLMPSLLVDESKSQEVVIEQLGPTGLTAKLSYMQSCTAKGIYFPVNDWMDIDTVDSQYHMTPAFIVNGKEWKLIANKLQDPYGNLVTMDNNIFKYNNETVAEIKLWAYLGGFSSADYIWIDERQSDEVQLLISAMVSYSLSFQDLSCHESQP